MEDFDPIFDELVRISSDSVKVLHDPDAFAAPFLPVAENLVENAKVSRDIMLRLSNDLPSYSDLKTPATSPKPKNCIYEPEPSTASLAFPSSDPNWESKSGRPTRTSISVQANI